MVDVKLDTRRTALVLIDMQNDVVKGRPPLTEEQQRVVDNCARLLKAARQKGIKVFLVKVDRRPDMADNRQTPVLGREPRPPQARMVEGTPGNQIIDELKPEPSDFIIPKRRVSAFEGTYLDLMLRSHGIDTLLLGGVATNWGVESTARSASDRDYNLLVVRDCCYSFRPEHHEFAMTTIFPFIGLVSTTDEVLKLIEA